jgi:hypothetical protein
MDVRAVLSAGEVAGVVEGEDAFAQAVPHVPTAAARCGEARRVFADVRAVRLSHVVAVGDQVDPDVAFANMILELDHDLLAGACSQYQWPDQWVRRPVPLRIGILLHVRAEGVEIRLVLLECEY